MNKRALVVSAAFASLAGLACTPLNYSSGQWHLEGQSFGPHGSDPREGATMHTCSPGPEPGSVDFEFALDAVDVVVFLLDENRPVEVTTTKSHVEFARADCKERSGTPTQAPDPSQGGQNKASGHLTLTCSRDGNTLSLDLTYACLMKKL